MSAEWSVIGKLIPAPCLLWSAKVPTGRTTKPAFCANAEVAALLGGRESSAIKLLAS